MYVFLCGVGGSASEINNIYSLAPSTEKKSGSICHCKHVEQSLLYSGYALALGRDVAG